MPRPSNGGPCCTTGKSDENRDPAGWQTGTPVSERRIPFRARAWRPARAQHALPAPGVRRALSYQRPWPRACAAWHRRIECKAVFLSVHTVFPFCFYLRVRLDGPRPGDGSSFCTRVLSATPVVRVRLGDDSSGSARVLSMTTEVREGLLPSAAGLLISTRTTEPGLPGELRVTLRSSWGALTGVLGAGCVSVSTSWSVPVSSAFWPSAWAASAASAAALALAASPSARAAAEGALAVLTCRKTEIQFPTRACLCVRVAEQWQNSNPVPQLFQNRNTVSKWFANRCTTLIMLLERKIPD